jgi:hypothetical protein
VAPRTATTAGGEQEEEEEAEVGEERGGGGGGGGEEEEVGVGGDEEASRPEDSIFRYLIVLSRVFLFLRGCRGRPSLLLGSTSRFEECRGRARGERVREREREDGTSDRCLFSRSKCRWK